MRDREHEATSLRQELATIDKTKSAAVDAGTLQQEIRTKLAAWRGLLRAGAPQARQILRKLIEGRISFTPSDQRPGRCRFVIRGTFASVLNGWCIHKRWRPKYFALGTPPPCGFRNWQLSLKNRAFRRFTDGDTLRRTLAFRA